MDVAGPQMMYLSKGDSCCFKEIGTIVSQAPIGSLAWKRLSVPEMKLSPFVVSEVGSVDSVYLTKVSQLNHSPGSIRRNYFFRKIDKRHKSFSGESCHQSW
ncbi:hypothetical protein ACF0H5_020480 [Mactra antiquata]